MTRTCEIFNAEALLVDDINVTQDKAFLSLSMTSEKWLPIDQVKQDQVLNYLKMKKEQGYAIVGVEQASNSQPLESFVFPEKVVVVLGKEKSGIPVPIMCVLDHVLEIPQIGLVRSLNVHVTGALVIWEYAKQRLSNK